MSILENLSRLMSRFRYPVSLPEEVAHDLGMDIPNSLCFHDFLKKLASPDERPTRLRKFMDRASVERLFESALKKEMFRSSSLFSYSFKKGWLVFALYFDEDERLRRAYLQCPECSTIDGFDFPLYEEPELAAVSSQ